MKTNHPGEAKNIRVSIFCCRISWRSCGHLTWLLASTSCAAADSTFGIVTLPWFFVTLTVGSISIAAGLWLQLNRKDDELQRRTEEQKKLRSELDIFRAVAEHNQVSTIITGPDLSIRYVNPGLLQSFGYEAHELIGRTPAVFQPNETPDATYVALWQALAAGQAWEGDLQNRRKDGGLFWHHVRILPLKADDGTIRAYLGLKLDLSESKEAEERFAENERMFGTILENLPCVVYRIQMDATGRELKFHYINGRVEIFGLNAEEVLHNPQILLERIHPQDRKKVVVAAYGTGQALQPGRTVFRMRRTDGRMIWIVNHGVPSRLSDGSIVWTGYSMDITARRHAEEQLRASEEKFRTLVESANDIIYTLDNSGRIDYVSPNWTEILGHPIDEVIGRNFDELLHPDDLAPAHEFLHAAIATGRRLANVEYRVRHRDGTWIWHTANGAPLMGPDGKPVGMFGIARDISERKQSEARILRMAHYDALTDLPNRSLILDRLEQALQLAARRTRKLALMFVDLDRFKFINDTYGHAIGDRVLQETARRMSEVLRGSDTVGRVGGDEFIALLTEIEDAQTAQDVAIKIRNAVGIPIDVDELRLHVSCSIGVAVYPDHGTDAPGLARNADLAMYRAKESGRAAIRLHEQTTHTESRAPA